MVTRPTSAWLDVVYGSVIRELLLNGLGGKAIHVVQPAAVPFDDAMTTAAIACFEVGAAPETMRLRLIASADELGDLALGDEISRDVLATSRRWSPLVRRGREIRITRDTVPLRQIARVHRGVVTGANAFFILSRERARQLGLLHWCRPAITRAEEILDAGGVVRNGPELRLLLDLPADIDRTAHPQVDWYLRQGEQSAAGDQPIAQRYIASRRRPWWRLGVPEPAPIVVSYMARQAPAFALNPDRLACVNVAHGLYPVRPMDDEQLAALVDYLQSVRESFRGGGRTYHGELEKFEPRELEALPIPAQGPWST